MNTVFLAHSGKDKRFVRRLAADLAEHGVRVWLDEAEILVGDSLVSKISAAIREMEYLAVVLSPESVESPWVQREVEMAMNDEIEGKKVKVLPILYRKCAVPGFLAGKAWADFTTDGGYRHGIERLLARFSVTAEERLGLFDGWTQEAVRSGVRCGLLTTDGGRAEICRQFYVELAMLTRSWFMGEFEVDEYGEITAQAAVNAVHLGKRNIRDLTVDEFHRLANEVTMRTVETHLVLGRDIGALKSVSDGAVLDEGFADEVVQHVYDFGLLLIKDSDELRLFVLATILHAVRSRMNAKAESEPERSWYLSCLLWSFFERSGSYEDWVQRVSDVEGRATK
jgi:hypothetical protein